MLAFCAKARHPLPAASPPEIPEGACPLHGPFFIGSMVCGGSQGNAHASADAVLESVETTVQMRAAGKVRFK